MLQVLRGPIVNQLGFLACWWLCAGFADAGGLAALVLILLHLALQLSLPSFYFAVASACWPTLCS
jgi:hypothetical protein